MTYYQSFIANLLANPLVVHETRGKQLSWRLFRRISSISFVLGIVGILFAIFSQTIAQISLGLALVCMLLVLTSPYIASSAAETTYQYIQGEFYDLICKTTLSNWDILKGLLFCALHQRRSLLLVISGAIPFAIMNLIFFFTFDRYYIGCQDSSLYLINCIRYLPSPDQVLQWLLSSVFLTLSIGSFILLGAVIGISAMLWTRIHLIAKLIAIVVTLFVLMLSLIGILGSFQYPQPIDFIKLFLISLLLAFIIGIFTRVAVRRETKATL